MVPHSPGPGPLFHRSLCRHQEIHGLYQAEGFRRLRLLSDWPGHPFGGVYVGEEFVVDRLMVERPLVFH